MKPERAQQLRRILEETHQKFLAENQIMKDAITPALAYTDARDREFAAFICAILAYGKVAHIQLSTRKILNPMGSNPVAWIKNASVQDLKNLTKGWVHRFNTSNDMLLMLSLLQQIYLQFESLEKFLDPQENESANSLFEKLHIKLRTLSPAPFKKFPKKGASFWFFLPHPQTGSACKRLNLYLRWMVGQSEMDLGLWTKFSRRELIIPVDTHVLKQARSLKLTSRKTADWKTAVEITNKLKHLDPEDPTRFDFALCHLGITGNILKL